MPIAVDDICACTRTLRVVDVARGTAAAIIGGGIVGDASAAGWTAPLVAAGTGTNIAHVATNGRSVIGTIGGRCTRLVAVGICRVLLVASGTGTAVLGAIVADSALVACGTSPLVATGACANRKDPSDIRSVIVAIKGRCADTRTGRVVGVASSTLTTGRTGVVDFAATRTIAVTTVD